MKPYLTVMAVGLAFGGIAAGTASADSSLPGNAYPDAIDSHAATHIYTVDTTSDTVDAYPGDGYCADAAGKCSLRAAVQESNAGYDGRTIVLGRKVYTLTIAGADEDGSASGDLDVSSRISISGAGAVIDANGLDRVFDVSEYGSLLLSDARLINGAPPETQSGGAIQTAGETSLFRVDMLNNAVFGAGASGGAIFNNDGALTVYQSSMNNNSSTRAGGAIEALAGLTLVDSSTMQDNTTGPMPGNGGALHLTGAGHVTVIGGLVERNVAASEGGGLWNSASGEMDVEHVIISSNTASGDAADNGGGGLFNDGGILTVTDSTIKGNAADGASGSGGGILNNNGTLTVKDSTLDGNTASRAGGGIESNVGENIVVRTNLTDNVTGPAPGNGGGLHITGAGNLLISASFVSGNQAAAEGGGLWNGSGTMNVRVVRVINNTASGAGPDQGGGGLFNNGGTMDVRGSVIDGNSADTGSGSGGGILNDQGILVVRNSSLIANSARRAGGGIESNIGNTRLKDVLFLDNSTGPMPGNGGGLHLSGAGFVRIDGSGVFSNDAANEGGGLWNSSTGEMRVRDTEIDGNIAPTGPEVFNQGGVFFIDGIAVPIG